MIYALESIEQFIKGKVGTDLTGICTPGDEVLVTREHTAS
jgi:hypothetical protein